MGFAKIVCIFKIIFTFVRIVVLFLFLLKAKAWFVYTA